MLGFSSSTIAGIAGSDILQIPLGIRKIMQVLNRNVTNDSQTFVSLT